MREWPIETLSNIFVARSTRFPARLAQAKVSGQPTDDLLILDGDNRRLQIVARDEEQRTHDREQMIHDAVVPVDIDGRPVAVLAMRLNRDALSDLVILQEGASGPTVALTAPMATFMVINTNDSGIGSLRQAILNANAMSGADMISFNIPGPGPHTIRPRSALPDITDAVTIDGYTQPGASANTNPITMGSNAVLRIESERALVRDGDRLE